MEGNDKCFARVKTQRTLVELLSKELDYQPAAPKTSKKDSQENKNNKKKKKKNGGK